MGGDAKTYTAPHAVYVDGLLTPEGQEFTTATNLVGDKWALVAGEADAQEPSPLDLSVADLSAHLQTVDDLAVLEALLAAERAGKTRKGALDAIQARIDELLA